MNDSYEADLSRSRSNLTSSSETLEGGGDRLNSRERETAGELKRLDPHLAGLYERGLELVRQIDQPGNASLVAHAGRELSRGVLALLFNEEGLEVAVEDVANAPSNEKHRPRIAEALALEADDPRVDEWFHVHGRLSKACHWPYGGLESAVVREAFERFASLLYGRLAPYYVTESDLDVLLEIKTPTREHAKRLRDLQLRPGQRNYFFRRLTNSAWVRHLATEHFFQSPPGRRENDDGSWSAKPWPEGDYLVSAAADEPEAVRNVLNSIPLTNDNPVVWDLVAKAGLQLPPDMAACIVPSLTNALKIVPGWFSTESFADLVVALTEAGREEAFELAEVLLRVVAPGDMKGVDGLRFRLRTVWVFPCLREHNCAELIGRVVAALEALDPKRTLRLLIWRVRRLQGLGDDLDLGVEWRLVDIHPESQPDHDDAVATILREAVGVGQRLAARGRDEASWVMEVVDRYNAEFVTRIGYLVLAEAGQHLQERIDELLGSDEFRKPGFPATEIAALLRSQFQNASPEVRRAYATAVKAGPNREVVAAGLRDFIGRDLTQQEVDHRIHRYQRRILTFFRGDIPNALHDLAESLGVLGTTPSYGDQRMAEVGSYVESGGWVGDESPISANELAQLSVSEIVALLVEGRQGAGTGSSSGLEGTLTTYANENPATALKVLHDGLGQGVESSLIEATVNGLCDAANADSELDWETALPVVRCILSDVRSLDPSADHHLGQWRRTAGRAVRLLEVGCRRDSVPHEHSSEAWGIITEVMTLAAIWDVPHSDDRSLESVVTATLNDAAGNAANAALSVALWDYRSRLGDEQEASTGVKAAVRAEVQEQLLPVLDCWLQDDGPNAAVPRAVMGDYLPQLQLLAPEWIEVHADALFDRGLADPASRPTWTTYIARRRLYDDVFRALRPWYVTAADNPSTWREAVGGSFTVGEITQHYGEHLILAALRGLVSVGDDDALLEIAYEHMVPSDWRGAYWLIFRTWSDANDPPSAGFIRRLIKLWEWRVSRLSLNLESPATMEEAKELSWLFHTPYVPDADRVRLGLKTAQLAKGQLQMYSRWDDVLSLAQTDPDGTYLIAEEVLLTELRCDHPHVPVEDVRPFLGLVLATGSSNIQARARHLINRLGERGYRQLKTLLDKNGRDSG